MKGDFSRTTFRKQDHYSRVLQQQGRVQLDADWNELNDIWLHRSRTTRYDVIGPACGPENDAGFEITASGRDLFIGTGRYYVNGILVELESADGEPISFAEQVDFPTAELPKTPGRYRAILDVWERHLTALEEPYIREVALGGPDTATRTRVMAQVKLIEASQNEPCSAFVPGPSAPEVDGRGLLSARSKLEDEAPNPCVVPPSAGYRRLENQLYRVEIHNSGIVGTATFKWSRENGSIVSRIVSRDGDNLVVDPPGRDENLGYHGTDWIEITDDQKELAGETGVLVQLASAVGKILTVDPSTLDGAPTLAAAVDSLDAASRKIRRWESPATEITTGSFITLEEGVQVQFEPPKDAYCAGDYWIIPARTNTGDVEWPKNDLNLPLPQPPRGIDHFLAPLALLTLTAQGNWTDIDDCRCLFSPLSDLPDQGCCCCTATVGDGFSSTGDFTDIQQAINTLAEQTGGKKPLEICILPGTYRLTKSLQAENLQLTLRGCGEQSQIISPTESPALLAKTCKIAVEALALKGNAPNGLVVLSQCKDSTVLDCFIENKASLLKDKTLLVDDYTKDLLKRRLDRYIPIKAVVRPPVSSPFPALVIRASEDVGVHNNHLLGFPAIILQAGHAEMVHNHLTGGGLWIEDGSGFIDIKENTIIKGQGPGILLGGIQKAKLLALKSAGVQSVNIARNQIALMGDSGIASATEMDGITGLGDLEDIRILENRIEGCGQAPLTTMDCEGVGGIVLKNGSLLRLQDNAIHHNGSSLQPACGILVEDCEEVSILDNAVQDNGSATATTRACADFQERDDDSGETPLEEQSMRFENVKAENGLLWRIDANVMGSGKGSGLRCQSGIRITLTKPINQLELLLIGSETTIRILNQSGEEIEKSVNAPTVNVQTPRLVTFRHDSMAIVEIAPTNRLWLQQACTGGATGYQAGIAALFVHGDDFRPPQDNSPYYTHEPGRSALVVQGNTVVTPAGQALWVIGTGQMMITDNELVSRDQYVQPLPEPNPEEPLETFWLNVAQVGRCVSVLNLGIALEFSDLLVNVGFTTRPDSITAVKQVTGAGFGREIPPGLIQFNDNQVIFYVSSPEMRMILPSTFVMSFDDVSFQDNQVRSDVENGLQATDAMILAATTRINSNRFAETFTGAFSSLLSFAMMNTTVGNIATHCIFAFARSGNLLNAANQVAITQNCGQKGTNVASHLHNVKYVDPTQG